MALRDRIEIYIPVEAEVKSIPLWNLPNSVQKRMGLLQSNSISKNLTDSPKGIWICPAVIRRKDHKVASHIAKDVKEDMVSLMAESQPESGSYRMSFVSSNRVAYKVLKDTMPKNTVSAQAQASHTPRVPQGLSSQTSHDSVVIYNGQIYLCMRKPKRNQSKQTTCKPKLASQSSAPSMSDLSSKSQTKASSDNELTNEQMEKVVANNDSGDRKTQQLGSEEAEGLHHITDMDSVNTNASTGEFGQGRSQSWTRRESLGASTSLHECDFQELAQEEMIARMKARLKEKEAALPSSDWRRHEHVTSLQP